MGRRVDCSWVWVGPGEPVAVLAREEAVPVGAFEISPAEKVVVTRLLELLEGADGEGVRGGNPKIEPSV